MTDEERESGMRSEGDEGRDEDGRTYELAEANMQKGMEALPRLVATATSEQLEQRMGRLEGVMTNVENSVKKSGALLEAYITLMNGAIFRDGEGISGRLPNIIDPSNQSSLQRLPLYSSWMSTKDKRSQYSLRLIAHVLYSFSEGVPGFRQWAPESCRVETKAYRTRLKNVSGLAAMFYACRPKDMKGDWTTVTGRAFSGLVRKMFIQRLKQLRTQIGTATKENERGHQYDIGAKWLSVMESRDEVKRIVDSSFDMIEKFPKKTRIDTMDRGRNAGGASSVICGQLGMSVEEDWTEVHFSMIRFCRRAFHRDMSRARLDVRQILFKSITWFLLLLQMKEDAEESLDGFRMTLGPLPERIREARFLGAGCNRGLGRTARCPYWTISSTCLKQIL